MEEEHKKWGKTILKLVRWRSRKIKSPVVKLNWLLPEKKITIPSVKYSIWKQFGSLEQSGTKLFGREFWAKSRTHRSVATLTIWLRMSWCKMAKFKSFCIKLVQLIDSRVRDLCDFIAVLSHHMTFLGRYVAYFIVGSNKRLPRWH